MRLPTLTAQDIHEHNRRFYQITCSGKQAFDDRALADRVARRYGNSVYRCKCCSKWHIGDHNRGRKRSWSQR
jgi:hypothetical protein